jgi:hypothetical protein
VRQAGLLKLEIFGQNGKPIRGVKSRSELAENIGMDMTGDYKSLMEIMAKN